ncbi:MAG: LamG domain-containing protein, partial [Nanoarchaeota archaeon]
GAGIYIDGGSLDHLLTTNRIYSSGGRTPALEIAGTAARINLSNNILRADGSLSFAVYLAGTNQTIFENNTLENSRRWINKTSTANATFTNTTFKTENGSIFFANQLYLNGSEPVEVIEERLNITQNRAFINTTNLSMFNIGANITLNLSGLGITTAQAVVDYTDTGTFGICPADVCTNTSFANSIFTFNVSHWTTFKAQEFEVNDAPSGSSFILNSTNMSKNDTTQNLTAWFTTSDVDGDVVRNITDFRKYVNGAFVSDALLNVQFDTNISSSTTHLIRDYSTYSNNVTLGADTRMPIWNSSMPIMGGSYQFDGTNDLIFVKNSSSLNITGPDLSVEAWIRSPEATTGEYDRIVNKAIAGGADPYNAYGLVRTGGSGTVQFELATGGGGSSTSVASTAGISANTWIHLVGTYDGNRMKLYVNGVLNNSALKTGNITGTTSGVTMGGNFEVSGEYFNGQIDGVRIYNRTLSANEILNHYLEGTAGRSDSVLHADALRQDDIWVVAVTTNDGLLDGATNISNNVTINHTILPSITQAILNSTNPLANVTTDNLTLYLNGFSDTDSARVVNITDWRLYNGSAFVSTTVLNLPFDTRNDSVATGGIRDYSTYGNNATLGGGLVGSAPDWNNSGIIGGTYIYDGTNDYINVPDSSSLDVTGDITVSAWVLHETTSYDAWEAIVTKGDTAYRLHLCGDTAYCPGGATNGFNFEMTGVSGSAASSTVVPAHHVWYFVVGTYDGTESKLYVNGSLVATQTRSGSISANSAAVQIGANAEAASRNWKGAIDGVQIFNRSLNASEILAMYDDAR